MAEERLASDVALIERFYAAFDRRDHRTMAASYTSTARFSDPVFQDLAGPRIGTMWRMLCERATDLRVECGPVRLEGDTARVEWQAWYTYSATGRRVHNRIAAALSLEQGLIRRHDDMFDLYRWARQALGVKGLVLGWTPPVQRAIRRQAIRSLDAFAARIAGSDERRFDAQAG
jgi:ketosteroid isomerase-like protein